jgi:hypothetical protein
MQEAHNLPFPYNNQTFCRYEPIEKRIEHAKVLIVNDFCVTKNRFVGFGENGMERHERKQTAFRAKNFGNGVRQYRQKRFAARQQPKTLTVHLSEVGEAAAKSFNPTRL